MQFFAVVGIENGMECDGPKWLVSAMTTSGKKGRICEISNHTRIELHPAALLFADGGSTYVNVESHCRIRFATLLPLSNGKSSFFRQKSELGI